MRQHRLTMPNTYRNHVPNLSQPRAKHSRIMHKSIMQASLQVPSKSFHSHSKHPPLQTSTLSSFRSLSPTNLPTHPPTPDSTPLLPSAPILLAHPHPSWHTRLHPSCVISVWRLASWFYSPNKRSFKGPGGVVRGQDSDNGPKSVRGN